MAPHYPDDDDGDALRMVAEEGADMTAPMLIEFTIAAPSDSAARSIAELASSRGYAPQISADSEAGGFSIYCGRTMIPTYDAIVEAQFDLNRICKPYGGTCDGWITAGNKQDH